MKIYAVGGAVRDTLMGLQPHDFDWVVVGASPQAMQELGYRAVGKDFPIFLHPSTQEEHALARSPKELVTQHGERAFFCSPDVTLEEDLSRRDLTINAMAQEVNEARQLVGPVIDPYGGQKDLSEKILRHVGDAFSDDPLRVLRVARFCARWPDFSIAGETQALARSLNSKGALNALSAERVRQEVFKGLSGAQPSRFLMALDTMGATASIAPELTLAWGLGGAGSPPDGSSPSVHGRGLPELSWGLSFIGRSLDWASAHALSPDARFALLSCALLSMGSVALESRALSPLTQPRNPQRPSGTQPTKSAQSKAPPSPLELWCERWKMAEAPAQTARLLSAEILSFSLIATSTGVEMAALFERADARRSPQRFATAWSAFEALCASVQTPRDCAPFTLPSLVQAQEARHRWEHALTAFLSVDAGAVAKLAPNPLQAREAVRMAREQAVVAALGNAQRPEGAEGAPRKRSPGI